MTFSVASSSMLALLATVACVGLGLSLVAGTPIAFTADDFERRHLCSIELAETINYICEGRTLSLAQLYPQSFGKRSKRSAPDDEAFYRPLRNGPTHECCQHPCGYSELRQYCALD